jgi:signal transduction histidine kinase
MLQNIAPFFALQAVGLVIFCVALLLSTRAPQRKKAFYILLVSLVLELIGTLLRAISFFFGSESLLIESTRNNADAWSKLESLGVNFFAIGLLLKPLFFLSLHQFVGLKQYVLPVLFWLAVVGWATTGFNRFGFNPVTSLSGIVFVVGAFSWLLLQLQNVRFQKQFVLELLRYVIGFLIALHLIFAVFFIFVGLDVSDRFSNFDLFRNVDFLLRYIRIPILLCVDALCLFFWIQNYSTQAFQLSESQKIQVELLKEKDLLIQNLINANALVRTGALAAGVTHELNQFLARIQLDVEAAKVYLLDKADEAKMLKVLNRVLEANQSAAALILNLKKLFIRQDEDMRRCDLDQLVRSVSDLYRERARQSNIVFDLRLRANTQVLIRESLMRQVIANLVGNAIDALDLTSRSDKKIRIETQLEGDRWLLRIEDNATGIRPENAHKIFSLFSTSKSEGSGIGLWLSRFIVEQHGGYIRFSNIDPEGVVFWVDMPVEPVREAENEETSKLLPL